MDASEEDVSYRPFRHFHIRSLFTNHYKKQAILSEKKLLQTIHI